MLVLTMQFSRGERGRPASTTTTTTVLERILGDARVGGSGTAASDCARPLMRREGESRAGAAAGSQRLPQNGRVMPGSRGPVVPARPPPEGDEGAGVGPVPKAE